MKKFLHLNKAAEQNKSFDNTNFVLNKVSTKFVFFI